MNSAIANLYRIMASGQIVVRASIWNDEKGYEIFQVEVLKIQSFLGNNCALSHFWFDGAIDFRRNEIRRIDHSFKVGRQRFRAVSNDEEMNNDLGMVVNAWSKKEDVLLGRNEEKEPNPWVTAQTPFFGNVFHSPSFQRSVPASHPEMFPVLAMCFSTMSEAFVGMGQHIPESEMLANFGSFVAQARKESTRLLYGTHS